jgi:hypothetical protein
VLFEMRDKNSSALANPIRLLDSTIGQSPLEEQKYKYNNVYCICCNGLGSGKSIQRDMKSNGFQRTIVL